MRSQQSALSNQQSAKKSNLPIRSCHCERSEAIPSFCNEITSHPSGVRNDKLQTLNSKLLNEKGIALAMVLILSAIVLAIMAGLIYMITSTTRVSGMQKNYKTALEAGVGGSEAMLQLIAARGDPFDAATAGYLKYVRTTPDACLNAKLNKSTDETNWAACTDYAKASGLAIDPADGATYDFRIDLGGSPYPVYRGYAKIVDTVEGNSGSDEGLLKSGVVNADSGEVTVKNVPYLYTIEVHAERENNPSERAKLSILYQY